MHDTSHIKPRYLFLPGPPARHLAGVFVVLALLLALAGPLLFGLWGTTLSVGLVGGIGAVAVKSMADHYPHSVLGACNVITALRAGLIAFVAGYLATPDLPIIGAWGLMALVLGAFALDGVDGWLARRAGLVSSFGARFDMEVDALFGAILALLALTTGAAGAEVLGLGFMRYGFVLASIAWPWLSRPLPESRRRKAVCVVQLAALIYLLVPGAWGAQALAGLATCALAWSFAVDIRWLARTR